MELKGLDNAQLQAIGEGIGRGIVREIMNGKVYLFTTVGNAIGESIIKPFKGPYGDKTTLYEMAKRIGTAIGQVKTSHGS